MARSGLEIGLIGWYPKRIYRCWVTCTFNIDGTEMTERSKTVKHEWGAAQCGTFP